MVPDIKQRFSFNFENAAVAMIDASPICLEVMTNILSGYGFRRMYRCTDLAAGTEVLKTHSIDLLLMDPVGFGDDGYDLIRWLRNDRSHRNNAAPIILVTSHTRVRMITSARQCGADYIIGKPFSTTTLLSRILWVASGEERRGELFAPKELVTNSGSGVEMW